MARIYILSAGKAEAGGSEFKASLCLITRFYLKLKMGMKKIVSEFQASMVCIGSSRTPRTIWWNSVSNKTKNNKTTKSRAVVEHAFNSSTLEAEAGELL